eukprot:g2004.t1
MGNPLPKKRYWSFGKCIPKFKIMLLSISFLLLLIHITTGLQCNPGEGLDGFGGPYEKKTSGTCDYWVSSSGPYLIMDPVECEDAQNSFLATDSNGGYSGLDWSNQKPRGCYWSTIGSKSYNFNTYETSGYTCSHSATIDCICKTKACRKCQNGRYSAGGTDVGCKDCPQGKFSGYGAANCSSFDFSALSAVIENVTLLASENAELKSTLASKSTQISILESQNTIFKENITMLAAENAHLYTQLMATNANISLEKTKVTSLNSTITKLTGSLEKEKERINGINTTLNVFRHNVATQYASINSECKASPNSGRRLNVICGRTGSEVVVQDGGDARSDRQNATNDLLPSTLRLATSPGIGVVAIVGIIFGIIILLFSLRWGIKKFRQSKLFQPKAKIMPREQKDTADSLDTPDNIPKAIVIENDNSLNERVHNLTVEQMRVAKKFNENLEKEKDKHHTKVQQRLANRQKSDMQFTPT